MERLNLEQLARLVDEPPTPAEGAVLDGDPPLRRELEALRSQTEALRNLPAMLPPPGGWNELEKKLLAAGLIRGRQGEPPVWRKWLQAAAALVIFTGGTAFGWLTGSTTGSPDNVAALTSVTSGPASYASLEEAEADLKEAGRQWQETFNAYQRLVSAQGQDRAYRDPLVQLAALETVMAATRAAVEEFPEDQFFNGVFVRTLAEHTRTRRKVALDSWH